jgi:hypothetical protein
MGGAPCYPVKEGHQLQRGKIPAIFDQLVRSGWRYSPDVLLFANQILSKQTKAA